MDLKRVPNPIRPNQQKISAESLNDLRDAMTRQLTGDGTISVQKFGNRTTLVGKKEGGRCGCEGVLTQQMTVLQEFDDYLLCYPHGADQFVQPYNQDTDAQQPASQQIYVAKPNALQRTPFDGRTVNLGYGTTGQNSLTYDSSNGPVVRTVYLNGGTVFDPITLTTGGTLTYDTTYYYRIAAIGGTGDNTFMGGLSNEQSITPTTILGNAPILTWEQPDPSNPATSFLIYRSELPSGQIIPTSIIAQVSGTTLTYTDTGSPAPSGPTLSGGLLAGGGLLNNTEYWYIVVPVIGDTEVFPSNIVNVTTTITSNTISLTWTAYPAATFYHIYRSNYPDDFNDNLAPTFIAVVSAIDGTAFVDAGTLALGGNYNREFLGSSFVQTINPQYFPGELIVAIKLSTGYLDPNGSLIDWIDSNDAGRVFSRNQPLKVLNGSSGLGDIVITSVDSVAFMLFDTTSGFYFTQGANPGPVNTSDVGQPLYQVIIHQTQASPISNGYVSNTNQQLAGTKAFKDGICFGEFQDSPFVPHTYEDWSMDGIGVLPIYLIGNHHQYVVQRRFITYDTPFFEPVMLYFEYVKTDPTGQNPVEVGFGFNQYGIAEASDIFGFSFHIKGDPFLLPDYTLCSGYIAGHQLFTGQDGLGNFINGLRVAT